MRFSVLRFAIIIFIFIIALIVTFLKVPTTFHVVAQTEKVEFTNCTEVYRWPLKNAYVRENDGQYIRVSGKFQFSDSIYVYVERIAFGDLWVYAQAKNSDGFVGTLYSRSDDPIRIVPNNIDIIIKDIDSLTQSGETIAIPFVGRVKIGQQVINDASGSTAMLRSGKIKMLAYSLIGREVFEAGNVVLNFGDILDVRDDKCETSGLIIVDERPALNIIYRFVGREATITKPGISQSYNIASSVFSRIKNDHLVQCVWIAFVFIIGLFKAITLNRDLLIKDLKKEAK